MNTLTRNRARPTPITTFASHAATWGIARTTLAWLLCMAAGLLTACGGGDSEDPGPPTGPEVQSGRVAAGGYIGNAVVFIDLNDNNLLDSNERRTTTDAIGRYTLTGLYANDLAAHSIVARVFPEATIADTSRTVGMDFTLKAPAGRGAFVSPYSTLVSGLMAGTPALTLEAAATQVSAKLRASTVPLTAPTQLDLFRDYVLDSTATTPTPTASDSRNLRVVAAALSGILSSTTAGLNQRQTLFDANTAVSFNAVLALTETQLTRLASGSWQFDLLTAAQQGDVVNNPAAHPNFFIDGNALLAGLASTITVSDLSAAVKDWIANSQAFQQFLAAVIVDLTGLVAEVLFKLVF